MKTREEVQRDHDTRKAQSISNRRRYVPGCEDCKSIAEKSRGHGPWHDASERCQVGFHEHCGCARCF